MRQLVLPVGPGGRTADVYLERARAILAHRTAIAEVAADTLVTSATSTRVRAGSRTPSMRPA